jgi:hypothetical protein
MPCFFYYKQLPKNKEAAEEEARRLAHNVSAFLASVPEKIGHLMPTAMAEQVRQAQQFAHLLYENLLVRLKGIIFRLGQFRRFFWPF